MHIEWTECTERLPEENDRFLCNLDGYVWIARYSIKTRVFTYYGKKEQPTHWAFLPYGIKE